jgi:hypothetical protein
LVQYLETGEPSEEIQKKPIMTHANIRGVNASLRKKEFKYVPGTKELYNLSWDPATQNVILFCREIIFIIFLESVLQRRKTRPASSHGLVLE